uniref:Uncharacterized protein n=1 Tax=Arundo donax TaxID=35708 RepID=A0A0A9FJU3_ARUDO
MNFIKRMGWLYTGGRLCINTYFCLKYFLQNQKENKPFIKQGVVQFIS